MVRIKPARGIALLFFSLLLVLVPAAAAYGFGFAVTSRVAAPSVDPRIASGSALRRHTGDPDHDGLPTWFERQRSDTNPYKTDTDGDGLSDGAEVRRYHTNPLKADTDGDGFSDREEILAGTNPRSAKSFPDRPVPAGNSPETPAQTGDGATKSKAKSGSSPTTTPIATKPVLTEKTAPVETPSSPTETPTQPNEPETPTGPIGEPETPFLPVDVTAPSACDTGAEAVTTAQGLIAAVKAKRSACVTAAIGDVELPELGNRSGVVISTRGGSIGELLIEGVNGLAVRWARLRSVTIRHSNEVAIEGSTIGGTKEHRVEDQLIFMPDRSENVIIRGNDIGWTIADNSGNTGYGCRCYGETNGLQFVGNIVHDLAADGFQGTNGANVTIDRNKIGPIGANPGSDEHSDNIQMVSNGPNLRITNNWILQQGYYEGAVTGNSGTMYIHGGTSNPVLIENNLVEEAQGRTEICGLGTGGVSRSNITIRNNTWIEGGLAFAQFPSFEWDCDSGTGNTVANNIAVDADGGFAQDGSASAATFSNNIWGTPSKVTLDASGNCTSANCNPAGLEAIGYRKPSGAPW